MTFNTYFLTLIGLPLLLATFWGHNSFTKKYKRLEATLQRSQETTEVLRGDKKNEEINSLLRDHYLQGHYCNGGSNIQMWSFSKKGEASFKVFPSHRQNYHKYYPNLLETTYNKEKSYITIGYARWAFDNINAFQLTLAPLFFEERKITGFHHDNKFYSQTQCPNVNLVSKGKG